MSRTTKGTSTIDGGPIKSVSITEGRALGPNPDLRRGPNDDLLLYGCNTLNCEIG